MLTIRGMILAAAAAGAWLLSRALGVPELGMAAVGILALLALAVAHTRATSGRLDARRSVHPHRLFFDDEAEVELTVANHGRLPTATVQVADEVPAALSESARFVLAPLASGDRARLRYRLRGRRRGRFSIGPVQVRLRDAFGVAGRRQTVPVTDEVTVYPPVWRLPPGLPLGGDRTSGGGGRARSSPVGEELAGVREYVRGDDLRRVHWRTTAHRGELMVRQDESPRNPEAAIVLDRRTAAHRGRGQAGSFETAVAAAASASYHLAQRAFRVRLLLDPDDPAPPPVTWRTALEQLAAVRTARRLDLHRIYRQLASPAGRGALLVVTALPDAEELRAIVRAGRASSVRLALLIDAPTFVGRDPAPSRDRTVSALRGAGWRAAVVGAGDRLDEAWAELVRQRHRTRRHAAGGARAT